MKSISLTRGIVDKDTISHDKVLKDIFLRNQRLRRVNYILTDERTNISYKNSAERSILPRGGTLVYKTGFMQYFITRK